MFLAFSPGAILQKADGDNDILERTNELLRRSQLAIVHIREYSGCANLIRSALSDAKNNELQQKCFLGVSPNIKIISEFFELSGQIG